MRIPALLGFVLLFFGAARVHAQVACEATLGRIVTATGTVSDFSYRQAKDLSLFFIRDTDLPCNSDIWVFASGRVFCREGKHATVKGRFDKGDIGASKDAYVLLTDAEHVACRR